MLDFALVHLFTDFVADPPCCFVSYAKLALQFFAAYTVARGDKQIDRVEPNLERRPGVLKDCASGRVKMIATRGTSPRTAVAHAVKRAIYAASFTHVTFAETDGIDVLKAGFIIREPFEKIANAEVGGC